MIRAAGRAAALTSLAVLLNLAVSTLLARAAQRPTTRVRVGTRVTGRRLPANFLSLSVEFRTVLQWAGSSGHPVDPVLVRLIRGLDPSGSPILRIGGQGGDRTWWPIDGVRRPPGVSDSLSSRWIGAARRLAAALQARYLLQVNLEAGQPRIARAEAEHIVSGLGVSDIAALEIGNEPDLYTSIPWYWQSDGRALPWYADHGTPVYARAAGYGAEAFVSDWDGFARALPRGVALAGPDLAGTSWLAPFAAELTRTPRLRYFDVHAYPVENCVTNVNSPRYPSVAHLLTLAASRDLLSGERRYIGLAHRAGARFLVDETGADSCGGNAGVSNSMASALWVLDMLFAMDRQGVDAVDLHDLPGTVNSLFDLRRSHGQQRAQLSPAYLGAVLFAQAAPAGSRLLSVSDPDPTALRVWATIGTAHSEHVVLINDGQSRVVVLRLAAHQAPGSVSLERLHARGASSTSGFVLGGREVSSTSTGSVKPLRLEPVRRQRGVYRFAMGADSALLVTVAGSSAGGGAGKVIDRG